MADLERFVQAQHKQYPKALKEIQQGQKKTHWMWYIFPQIKGLGYSDIAKYYEIQSIAEAEAYMKHKQLGCRLTICCNELMLLPTDDAVEVFGEIDAQKLKSCMTLFDEVSGLPVFKRVLDKFFKGKRCQKTMKTLIRMRTEATKHERPNFYQRES